MVVDNRLNSTFSESMDTSKVGTTTFVETSNVVTNATIKPQERSQLYPVRDQTISDFLAKPHLVDSFTWTTAQTVNSVLATNSVWSDLTSNPLWTNKMLGFNFIRATAVYRVVVNGNPFHAGLLKFGFIPFANSVMTAPNLQPTWRANYLSTFSTVPGAMFEVKDSTAIVRIPYVSTVDYATLQTSDQLDWGGWAIKVYSPLATGAANSQSVDVAVYLHFEDVEMAVPYHPQSTAPKKTFKGARFVSKIGSAAKEEIASAEASVMASGGVLSRGLMAAGKVATILEEIPVLSSIAGPTSWVLRGASTVASWFGFSKPDLDSAPTNVQRLANPNMPNATGADTAVTLALFHDNSVEMKPGFGADDLDEMNFNYIKKIPGYIDSRGWATTDLEGAVLFKLDIGPQALYEAISNAAPAVAGRCYPPFGYLSTFFRVYRGSIDIHIKMLKTDYHSGRLAFVYTPGALASVPSLADQPYLLREIVDIREKSEIVFRLPYLEYQKFIGVDKIIGKLYVIVVNELKAPDTVRNVIDMVISASAGDDFEYAIPGMKKVPDVTSVGVPFIPQMGSTAPDVDQSLVLEPIGNYPSMNFDDEAVSMSIGEKFTSIRQLLLRYTVLCNYPTAPTYGALKAFAFWPYTTAIPVNLPASTFIPKMSMDALCRLAHGYAFMRGSIRVLIPTSLSTTSQVMRNNTALNVATSEFFDNTIDPSLYNGTLYSTASAGSSHCDAAQVFDRGVGTCAARMPYYCENHSTAILPVENNLIPQDVWDPYSMLTVTDEYAAATAKIKIYRSVGEDFQLGYFLGFPPVMKS